MTNKIAIIKTGGKQYKVREGQNIMVEKIEKKEGSRVAFDTLMVASTDGKDVSLGKPSLGKKTEGKVAGQEKQKKVSVIKFKNKTRYLRNKGHRQQLTKVEIVKIG